MAFNETADYGCGCTRSTDPEAFCSQVIDTSLYATDYWKGAKCYLQSSDTGSVFWLTVPPTSTIGCDKIPITLYLLYLTP
ncbi:hypothetical protein COB52_05710 [Candidatus Kaiserbacteria bacterium]|nr:MAG: hypothetical protein COB52_05710 [Candidatus Kaiserbacteria bacterium]